MVKEVHIDLGQRRVTTDGRPVDLRAKSFDLLALLAVRPGHLFPRDVLIDRVWQGRSVSPDVLTGCIREIRHILGDDARSPVWIETVQGHGYRLLRTVTAMPSAAATPPCMTGDVFSAAAASVAVLQFVPLDPALAPIAQALSRDITVGLARTRWLRVAASASIENLPPTATRSDAATTFGVRYVLDGDLRRAKTGVALQVTLTDTETAHILWADRMEGCADDPADLMVEVCAVIVAAVENQLEAAERRRALLSPVRGMDAWIGFHRAMTMLQGQNAGNLDEAARTLREASRADPACARVAAARSWHCWQEVFFGKAGDRLGALARGRDFALESIALDALDPLGYWALGRVKWLAGEVESAVDDLARSVALNPSFAVGHYSLGYSLYLTGRQEEAMACYDEAIRLSPLDPLCFAFHCVKAHALCFSGDAEGAVRHARLAADHPNVHPFGLAVACWVLELSGERTAAAACLARLRRRAPSYTRSDYMASLLHQDPHYPDRARWEIERAFDRLGF